MLHDFKFKKITFAETHNDNGFRPYEFGKCHLLGFSICPTTHLLCLVSFIRGCDKDVSMQYSLSPFNCDMICRDSRNNIGLKEYLSNTE